MSEQDRLISVVSPSASPIDLTIVAWLHAKHQKSQSQKTHSAYASILQVFRTLLHTQGCDLDAADPQQVRRTFAYEVSAQELEAIVDERLTLIAVVAQAFAAQPAQTRYGPKAVAPATANVRLATLSSFYTYALRQGFFHGLNPILRVERRKVQAYAQARPLPYESLPEHLNGIDLGTPIGLRDYALLLLALHTGRRLSELTGMQRQDVVVRKAHIEIVWPRCKGGKVMRDDLPLRGKARMAADALVAWLAWLAKQDQAEDLHTPSLYHPHLPIWISLANNGTYGHPLSPRHVSIMCEKRLGTSKVHALRHTFARALEDAGAKVSDIQARLGHASLDTTGRYLAQLHDGENPHLARLASLYGLTPRSVSASEEEEAQHPLNKPLSE